MMHQIPFWESASVQDCKQAIILSVGTKALIKN
jgi:hypothetical protein